MEKFNIDIIKRILKDINIKPLSISEKDLLEIWNDSIKRAKIIEASQKIYINSIILVKNQEENIKDSIKSALRTSDHTFVFDTGSTDKTIEIIKKTFSADDLTLKKILWKENYSYMRNLAASYVPDGWVLILDSDEVIEPHVNLKYLKLILGFIDYLFPKNSVSISFKQKAEGVSAFAWPERMYKKNNNIRFYGYVHEELRADSLISIQSQFVVVNKGTSDTEIAKFNKSKRYFNLCLKSFKEEPNYIKWIALMPINEALKYDSSWYLRTLRKYIKLIDTGTSTSIYNNYIAINYIHALLVGKQDVTAAAKATEWALTKFPTDSRLYAYKYEIKNFLLANQALNVIIELRQSINYLKSVSNENKWQQYSISESIGLLEQTLSKLLIKAEEYDIASNLSQSEKK
ncbi:glycosyltransferase [Ligilactobacillus acidipiscis]|uniref:glycosyltransferase n=1 Tax=Ligilactobacillus acidipiscis TaxID=89059 RepID=UPI0022DEDEB7|nr:glycosyltransferase [Ligilactobacillus acidipiscis]